MNKACPLINISLFDFIVHLTREFYSLLILIYLAWLYMIKIGASVINIFLSVFFGFGFFVVGFFGGWGGVTTSIELDHVIVIY